jgi:hypothetical protein
LTQQVLASCSVLIESAGNAVAMKVALDGKVKDMLDVAHFSQIIPIASD